MSIAGFAITMTLFIAAYSGLVAASVKRSRKPKTVSSDGHTVPKEQDLTCARYGHKHEDRESEFGRRYVVHEEPTEGYVVLNGVLRKISECRNL